MENNKIIIAILLLFFNVYVSNAQKMHIIDMSCKINLQSDTESLIGKKFIYINSLKYSSKGAPYSYKEPPYPFSNGRVKKGKYQASPAAFDEYVNTIKQFDGKSFTFAGSFTVDEENCDNGALMVSETGDTLYFRTYLIELVSEDYIASQKKKIGSVIYVNTNRSMFSVNEFYTGIDKVADKYYKRFFNAKTGIEAHSLPVYSGWKITNVCLDYSFDKVHNTGACGVFPRVKFTITNPDYGEFDFFPEALDYDFGSTQGPESLPSRDFGNRTKFTDSDKLLLTKWADKGFVEAMYEKAKCIDNLKVVQETLSVVPSAALSSSTVGEEEILPQVILECAKKGSVAAMYEIARNIRRMPISDMESLVMQSYKVSGKNKLFATIFQEIAKNYRYFYMLDNKELRPKTAEEKAVYDEFAQKMEDMALQCK